MPKPERAFQPPEHKRFPVWRPVTLGTGLKTYGDFTEAFSAKGHLISENGKKILCHPSFVARDFETEISLVRVSVAELGFPDGAMRRDICGQALLGGLAGCPAEVGPQLRLQYPDQPIGESLKIGMLPVSIKGLAWDLNIFCVERDNIEPDLPRLNGDLSLRVSNGDPNFIWRGTTLFVFRVPWEWT